MSFNRPREMYRLRWWETNSSTFSKLGNVANKMLCPPPSSVENEAFSALVVVSTHASPQPNNAGDWGEIEASELQEIK